MRTVMLFCMLVAFSGCARTVIKATLPDGATVEFYDNKTRQGTTVNITSDGDKITGLRYTSDVTDANSVALKALGIVEETLEAAKTVTP